jgi:effector-binding domain-containing protein
MTGGVTNTTFNIKNRYSNDRYNAEPLFFNGTELFVACKEGNFIKGYYSGVYHDFPAELWINRDVKYGKIGSKSYLFYSRFTTGWEIDDIYSYDMSTTVSLKFNVGAKVKDYFIEDIYQLKSFNKSKMTIKKFP